MRSTYVRYCAVIRAMGTSSDGKGHAIYAPSSAGQVRALKETYRLAGVARHASLAALRWTVDVPPDLAFVREVYAKLYPFDPAFGTEAIVALPVNSSEIPA